MTTEEALSHFGSPTALARALGIAAPSLYTWGEFPPPLRQIQLQQITGGELQANADVFEVSTKRAKALAK
jgi:hypothetical protein